MTTFFRDQENQVAMRRRAAPTPEFDYEHADRQGDLRSCSSLVPASYA